MSHQISYLPFDGYTSVQHIDLPWCYKIGTNKKRKRKNNCHLKTYAYLNTNLSYTSGSSDFGPSLSHIEATRIRSQTHSHYLKRPIRTNGVSGFMEVGGKWEVGKFISHFPCLFNRKWEIRKPLFFFHFPFYTSLLHYRFPTSMVLQFILWS